MSVNPALFKLKISQAKCPVYTGQILPLLTDKLKLNQNDSLNHAFYKVHSVSRQQQFQGKSGKKETYHLSLSPVEYNEKDLSWSPVKDSSVSPHPFDISVSSENLHDHFGIFTASTTNRAAENMLHKYVEFLFKKAGRHQDFIEKYSNIDYDKTLRVIALKAMQEMNLDKDTKEDIFYNALVKIGENQNVIRGFNPEKGSFLNYFWAMFTNTIRNELRDAKSGKYERSLKQINLGDSIVEEQLVSETDVEEEVTSKEVLADFKEYLSLQKSGNTLVEIVNMLLEKVSRKEICEKLDVHKTRVHQLVQKIIEHLKSYAKEAENSVLLESISEATKKKSAAEESEDISLFKKIFDLYSEKLEEGEHTASGETTAEQNKLAERVPVGEVIKIKRRPLPNFEELTKKVVQDPEKSSKQAVEDVEAYLREITSADELIEHDGKLIAIKIQRRE